MCQRIRNHSLVSFLYSIEGLLLEIIRVPRFRSSTWIRLSSLYPCIYTLTIGSGKNTEKIMNEKDFLFFYMLGVPIMIWSTTFILAFIRIWHRNNRDLTEERKKWEEQQRIPAYHMRERRVVRRRRRKRRPSIEGQSRSGSKGSAGTVGSKGSDGSQGSAGKLGIVNEKYRPETKQLYKKQKQ